MSDSEEVVRIDVTDVFDLHSVPPRDVKAIVEAYLEEARRLGYRHVRIIHGKGVGVQREIVRAVLARTPYVESFGDAPLEAGSWGATLASLQSESRACANRQGRATPASPSPGRDGPETGHHDA